jgi:hypothetical protein
VLEAYPKGVRWRPAAGPGQLGSTSGISPGGTTLDKEHMNRWNQFVEQAYCSLQTGSVVEASNTLRELGKSEAEIEVIVPAMQSIAQKAGSLANFKEVLTGEAETPIRLSAGEMAMLAGGGGSSRKGTWTGNSYGTWEGKRTRR